MLPDGPNSGTEIGGYRVGGLLGKGGMGAVYQATDRDGAEVVLKLIHPEFRERGDITARFAREAAVTSRLSHPAIVRVVEADVDGSPPFIAMEYVQGRTLADVLRSEAPLPVSRATAIARQMLSPLAHTHAEGVVHRDLKPANIMVTGAPGEGEQIKILDFGIAGLFDGARHTRLTQTGSVLGTPGYLAPEQVQGLPVDGRTDLWAVGVILYAMLSNSLPFPGTCAADRLVAMLTLPPPPITAVRSDLPPALVAVIARMLEKEPADRFQTAAEAGQAITAAAPQSWDENSAGEAAPPTIAAAPTAAGPAPSTTRLQGSSAEARSSKGRRSSPLVLALVVAAALGAVTLVVGGLVVGRPLLEESQVPASVAPPSAAEDPRAVTPVAVIVESPPMVPSVPVQDAGASPPTTENPAPRAGSPRVARARMRSRPRMNSPMNSPRTSRSSERTTTSPSGVMYTRHSDGTISAETDWLGGSRR